MILRNEVLDSTETLVAAQVDGHADPMRFMKRLHLNSNSYLYQGLCGLLELSLTKGLNIIRKLLCYTYLSDKIYSFELFMFQELHPRNSVTLSKDIDAFRKRKINIDLKRSEGEGDMVKVTW